MRQHRHKLTLWGLAGGIALACLIAVSLHPATLGVENFNPGNIRDARWQSWQGAVGIDPGFYIRFKSDFWGMRAIQVNLKGYAKRGLNTPAGIAARWGPLKASEADKANYTRMLCQALGHGAKPGTVLDMNDPHILRRLAHGIVRQENGSDPYPRSLYEKAFP